MAVFYAIIVTFPDGERPPLLVKKMSEVRRLVGDFLKMQNIKCLRIRKVCAK